MTGIRWLAATFITAGMLLISVGMCAEADAQSLVHRWSFENDYLDTSGSFNDGAASGAPTFVAGKFGQAVSLNSGSDGVHLDFFANNLPLQPTDHWTMNVWLNLATAPAALEHIAGFSLDNGYIGAADNGRARSFTSQTGPDNNNFYFWGANADRSSGVGYSADSQWHMYTVMYDGTNISMYKDASLVASGPPVSNAFQTAYDEVHVGNPSQWAPDAFLGLVDEFTIFNGTLSEGQLGGMYVNNNVNQPAFLDPSFTVNRDTGEIVLTNDSSFNIDVLGYTIKSASGSLQPVEWDTIAGRYDLAGDDSIDNNHNWQVFTNTSESFSVELSEGAPGTDGGTINIGKVVNFGPSWAGNPTEDITIDLLLDDGLGTIKTIIAEFVGNDDVSFAVGDFDADGDVDTADWQHFRTRTSASLVGATDTEAYLGGDLDGDNDKDIFDFDRFVRAYDDANGGSGAFQAMMTGVPEPSSFWLVGVAVALSLTARRKKISSRAVGFASVLLVAGYSVNAHGSLIALYQFNGDATETMGSNIDLNLVGDAGYTPSLHAGLGKALSMDGDGDGALGADFVKIQTSNATVVAWVYATSLDGTFDSIVKQWGDVRGQFHFGLGGGTPAGSLNLLQNEYGRTSSASTTLTSTTPDPFPTNQWVHVAFTLDSVAGFHRLYVNGDVVGSAAYPGPGALGNKTTGGNPRGIGIGLKPNTAGTAASTGAPGYWNGYIDEVGIYDHALSEADIEQIIANSNLGIQLDGTSYVPEPDALSIVAIAFGMVALRRRKLFVRTCCMCALLTIVALSPIESFAAINSYYQLNGNANEDTGANINLSLIGNPTFTGSVHPGLGLALSLDGNGDGAIGANYNKIQTNDVTAVAWVYATSLEGTWDQITSQWSDVRGQFHFSLGAMAADQLRNEYGTSATTSVNLIAANPNPFPTNEWVHVAFVLNSSTLQHQLFVNGDVVAMGSYGGTLGNKTTGSTVYGIGAKPNNAGTGPSTGAPGYWNGYIDEVGVYNHAMSESDIEQIISNSRDGIQLDGTTVPFIRLEVERDSGEATLINDSPAGVGISAYQITSPSGRLQSGGWLDLAGNAGFPTGNGTGNGWEKDAASNANQLLETYFAGTSNFGNGVDISLGEIFAGGEEDLELYYRTTDGYIVKSVVDFVGEAAGLDGDYNDDGKVDAADYVVWRKTNSGNLAAYNTWRTNFGNSQAGSGGMTGGGESSVPEPTLIWIVVAATLAVSTVRR